MRVDSGGLAGFKVPSNRRAAFTAGPLVRPAGSSQPGGWTASQLPFLTSKNRPRTLLSALRGRTGRTLFWIQPCPHCRCRCAWTTGQRVKGEFTHATNGDPMPCSASAELAAHSTQRPGSPRGLCVSTAAIYPVRTRWHSECDSCYPPFAIVGVIASCASQSQRVSAEQEAMSHP
ncbi:hypothetical protein VTI74DRAFT_3690 [Chaetomium olivicolor]